MCYTELVIPRGVNMFSLNNTPLTLKIFEEMCAICLSHFNLEFKITH